jgi:hypothetical protein
MHDIASDIVEGNATERLGASRPGKSFVICWEHPGPETRLSWTDWHSAALRPGAGPRAPRGPGTGATGRANMRGGARTTALQYPRTTAVDTQAHLGYTAPGRKDPSPTEQDPAAQSIKRQALFSQSPGRCSSLSPSIAASHSSPASPLPSCLAFTASGAKMGVLSNFRCTLAEGCKDG